MRCKIKPFGFPIYFNCKRRIAKKHINRRGRDLWKRYIFFHNYYGIVSNCTGLNGDPINIEPIYIDIGRKSSVIWDLDISFSNNSCSFYHCGIDKPKSYQECVKYVDAIIDYYETHPDDYDFAERYKQIKLTLKPDGTY